MRHLGNMYLELTCSPYHITYLGNLLDLDFTLVFIFESTLRRDLLDNGKNLKTLQKQDKFCMRN